MAAPLEVGNHLRAISAALIALIGHPLKKASAGNFAKRGRYINDSLRVALGGE